MSIYLKALLILGILIAVTAVIGVIVSFFCNMEEKHPIAAKILGGTTFTILLYLFTLAVLKLKSSGFHIDILPT